MRGCSEIMVRELLEDCTFPPSQVVMLGGIWWCEGMVLADVSVDGGCARACSNGGVESSKVFTTLETEVLGCYAGTSLPSIFVYYVPKLYHQHIACFPPALQ